MQTTAQDNHDFEMSLRDQLIAAQNGQPPPAPPQPAAQAPEQHYPPPPQQPTHQHVQHLDPSISGQHVSPYAMPPTGNVTDPQDVSPASKKAAAKAQRELSTTKRAAQNRAAQRAFRQRKEQYIGTLEEDIKRYRVMEQDFKTLQEDNNALRTYIMELQGKLSEAKVPFPPAPSTARVALPNPVVYDIGEASAPQGHPPPVEHPTFVPHANPEEQRYHPDLRHDINQDQRQQSQQQYQHTQHPERVSQSTNTSSDMPSDAFERLRAAAAQAGELDASSHSSSSPPEHAGPGGYVPDGQPSLKRARMEEPDGTGNRGTAGGVLRGLVNRITGMTGTKA